MQWFVSAKRISASLLTLLAFFVSSSPARAGFDNLAGTKPGELDFGGQFEGADGCAVCHGGGFAGDRSYLPHDSWAGTMMGNAARDPIFRAALAIANQDEPGIGTFCLRCHSPIAFVRGHATPADGSAFDAVDMQGIGCDTCHRAVASGPSNAPYNVGNAQIVYSNDLDKRGPYSDSVAAVHATLGDPALSTSHFCGQCHQVTHPGRLLRETSGAQTLLEFPLDTTYQEWQNSDFALPGGAECIDCHLERTDGDVPVATSSNAPLRKNPRNHAFVGANLFGIRAVMATDVSRANAYPDAFVTALEKTQKTIESAARVEILTIPANAKPGSTITVTVRVENLTGHKFPTGYAEGRRAWIALVLVAPNGDETFLRGGYDDVTGDIVDPAATHVYRAQHGNWNGIAAQPSEHLARHDMILSDTRIPPKGFVAAMGTAPTLEIDYGNSVVGYRHYDDASFDLTIPVDAAGDSVFSARIYYQPITRAYVEFLAATNVTDSSGLDLLAFYETSDAAKPSLVTRHDAAISISTGDQSSSVSSGMGGASGGETSGGATSAMAATNGSGGADPSAAPGCDCASTADSNGGFGAVATLLIAALARIRRTTVRLSKR
jgi:MYXO-CTERM domain-containing protein